MTFRSKLIAASGGFALALGAAVMLASSSAAEDAAGERVFRRYCAVCHAVEAGRNRTGPSLFGIVGRRSGTVEGFRYSNANRSADVVWDREVLERYLANPQAIVRGTTMTFAGVRNERERHDLIEYLGTLR